VVRLHNPGDAPVDGAELFVTVGRGDTATRLVPTPRVDPIDAGATVTYRIPVSLGGLAFGSYTTKLEVIGGAEPVVLEERTSAYPWGLAVVFLLLVQLGLLAVRNRLQRRVAREALASLEPIAELPAAEVIDLTDPPPVPVGDAGAGFAMTAAPIADVEAVAAAARRVTDVSLAALARPAATDLDTLDLLRALEDRAAHVLDDVVRQVEALRSELVGACDDIRAEAADRRQRDDDAAAAARHGLAVAMHALDARSAELVEHLDQLGGTRPDEAEVIDLVHPTRAPDPVDEALGRGILRALRS